MNEATARGERCFITEPALQQANCFRLQALLVGSEGWGEGGGFEVLVGVGVGVGVGVQH